MSNESGVYVGPVVIVDVGFETMEVHTKNYCVNCKQFCNGTYCKDCGELLQAKHIQKLRDYRDPLIEEGYSEGFFGELPVENKNKSGVVILGPNCGYHSISGDVYYGGILAFDGKTIDKLMKSFKEDYGDAVQSLIDFGFKCEIKFAYVHWGEY